VIRLTTKLGGMWDKWVALQDKRVVASGKSVREVQEKVARKKITDFAFHYVPSKRLAMVV
jgi:Family of unknown function (DUF5678)